VPPAAASVRADPLTADLHPSAFTCARYAAIDAVRRQFRSNDGVRDPIVVDRLIAVGHQELEETLMQWKQKSQLMKVLEGIKTGAALKVPGSDASDEDTFYRHDPR